MHIGLLSLSTELLMLIASAASGDWCGWPDALPPDSDEGTTARAVLGNLRLTCRRLSAAATPFCFRRIVLRPAAESIEKWHALLDDPRPDGPRALVCHVAFESEPERQDDCTINGGAGDPEPVELTAEWRAVVARLKEFEGVEEVYVRFSPQCGVDDEDHEDHDGSDWYEFRGSDTMAQRRTILTTVFEAIAAADKSRSRRIRALSIENLQNVVDTKFTDLPVFGAVVEGLEELHVNVATEADEAAPENALGLPSIVKFWPAFASVWLQRAAPSLTALTLYCDNYFGAVPFWQGAGQDASAGAVAFPKLKALGLGNYALAYESQLDWLADGEKTFPRLESLTMDDCPILSHLLVNDNEPDFEHLPPVDKSKLDVLRRREVHVTQTKTMLASRLRWDTVFNRLREGLPSLKTLFFTRGEWGSVRISSPSPYNTKPTEKNIFEG